MKLLQGVDRRSQAAIVRRAGSSSYGEQLPSMSQRPPNQQQDPLADIAQQRKSNMRKGSSPGTPQGRNKMIGVHGYEAEWQASPGCTTIMQQISTPSESSFSVMAHTGQPSQPSQPGLPAGHTPQSATQLLVPTQLAHKDLLHHPARPTAAACRGELPSELPGTECAVLCCS